MLAVPLVEHYIQFYPIATQKLSAGLTYKLVKPQERRNDIWSGPVVISAPQARMQFFIKSPKKWSGQNRTDSYAYEPARTLVSFFQVVLQGPLQNCVLWIVVEFAIGYTSQ